MRCDEVRKIRMNRFCLGLALLILVVAATLVWRKSKAR